MITYVSSACILLFSVCSIKSTWLCLLKMWMWIQKKIIIHWHVSSKPFSVVCFTSVIFYLLVHFCCPKGITEPVDLAKNNGNAPQEYQVASEILPGKISLSSCPWLLTLVISRYSTQFLTMYNDYRICEYHVLKYSIVVHVQIKLQRLTTCLPQGQFLHKKILTA